MGREYSDGSVAGAFPNFNSKGAPVKLPITVIFLTLNEEEILPSALENVKDWAQEIFVVDSLSLDRTVEIALSHGA